MADQPGKGVGSKKAQEMDVKRPTTSDDAHKSSLEPDVNKRKGT